MILLSSTQSHLYRRDFRIPSLSLSLSLSQMVMAAIVAEETSETLKYQTWILKVPIHCEGCKKQVKKLLQTIDGVYTTTIDSQQQKVTVTGNVEAETLLKKLKKTGKYAEIWPPANLVSGKQNKKDPTATTNVTENHTNQKLLETVDNGGKLPESSPDGEESAEVEDSNGSGAGKNGGGGKKKKKKGQNSNNGNGGSGSSLEMENTGAQFQEGRGQGQNPYLYPYPTAPAPAPAPAPIYGYNAVYPSRNLGPYYYLAPPPYTYANSNPNKYPMQASPFDSYVYENPSWCSIM